MGKESWIMHTTAHLHRRRSVERPAIIVALAALFLVASASAQVGLGLAPMRVEMRMAPGQTRSGVLTLSNDSGGKIRMRTELLDFMIDAADTPQFERNLPQEQNDSCRTWLTVNPMEAELEPGQLAVRYSIRVPEGTPEGSYHCGAGFTSQPPVGQEQTIGIQMAVRAVAAIYVVIGNPAIVGETKTITIEPIVPVARHGQSPDPSAPHWNAVVVLANHGHMHFRPSGQLELIDRNGKVVSTQEFVQLPVLPLRDQRFLFPLQDSLANAPYTLRARVDIGNGEVQEAVATITDPAPSKH